VSSVHLTTRCTGVTNNWFNLLGSNVYLNGLTSQNLGFLILSGYF
jgi:hypothetical protein